jgi:hypothetical protein
VSRRGNGAPERALVAMGFTRDLHEHALELATAVDAAHLAEVRPGPLRLERFARPIAEETTAVLRGLASRGASEFHILFAGPAPLALAVGRQLRALGRITVYYADEDRRPTVAFRDAMF